MLFRSVSQSRYSANPISPDGSRFTRLQRGQMMGHILSFPLLCMINYSASSLDLPSGRFMRINGDDVLFPANRREYRQWEINTKNVGLKKSIGKNYYSRDMAMINSEVYTWSKEKKRLIRLQFPNVGLLGYLSDFRVNMDRERPSDALRAAARSHLAKTAR